MTQNPLYQHILGQPSSDAQLVLVSYLVCLLQASGILHNVGLGQEIPKGFTWHHVHLEANHGIFNASSVMPTLFLLSLILVSLCNLILIYLWIIKYFSVQCTSCICTLTSLTECCSLQPTCNGLIMQPSSTVWILGTASVRLNIQMSFKNKGTKEQSLPQVYSCISAFSIGQNLYYPWYTPKILFLGLESAVKSYQNNGISIMLAAADSFWLNLADPLV